MNENPIHLYLYLACAAYPSSSGLYAPPDSPCLRRAASLILHGSLLYLRHINRSIYFFQSGHILSLVQYASMLLTSLHA
jgi:hypothetical protein